MNYIENYVSRNHWQFGIPKEILATGKMLVKSALINLYNTYIMHRFGITLSTCSLTWQDITTLTFINIISFEDTSLVEDNLNAMMRLTCSVMYLKLTFTINRLHLHLCNLNHIENYEQPT